VFPLFCGNDKSFKSLNKLIEKGETAKGDAYHVERSGTHLTCQVGPQPGLPVSGVRVFPALTLRNPSPVGLLVLARKTGISL
jgi:hypothetical protein